MSRKFLQVSKKLLTSFIHDDDNINDEIIAQAKKIALQLKIQLRALTGEVLEAGNVVQGVTEGGKLFERAN